MTVFVKPDLSLKPGLHFDMEKTEGCQVFNIGLEELEGAKVLSMSGIAREVRTAIKSYKYSTDFREAVDEGVEGEFVPYEIQFELDSCFTKRGWPRKSLPQVLQGLFKKD